MPANRRGDAGFIDKNQPLRIKLWLLLLQRLTCGRNVWPVLLGGTQAFFEAQIQMVQKSRDRRLTDRPLLRRQDGLECGQRDIRLLRHQFPDHLLVSRQSISLVPAELGRTDAARFAVEPAEVNDRADAHSELLRNFRDSSAISPFTYSPLMHVL